MAVYTKPVVTNKVPTPPKMVVAKPYTDRNAEIQRTQSVIAERQKAGMDVSAQLSHYQNLTGKSYSAPTTPTTYTAPSNSPQYGFGTIAENNAKKVGYTDKNTEINRTIGVIGNRFNDDMDIASQLAHYKNLTGKDFTKDGRYNELVVTKDVTGKVKAEIEAKTKALKDQLAMQQQASDLAIGQNNAYLSEQIGKMQKQKVVNDDSSIKLQNRRGGFYSGGLDYQLGQNASSYNEASGSLSRDVAQRNADIYAKNSMLASQAAEQISQLQQSAPSLIRERVLQELDRQRGIQMDEAKLTGMYNGAPTFEAQQWNNEFGLKRQDQQFDQQFQLQQFAYQKLRDSIEDKRWQQQFDQDVNQFGLNFALQKQIQMGNLSLDQARLALQQDQFTYDQQQANAKANQQPSVDINKYTGQLNKTYLSKDEDGNYVLDPKKEDGLYKSIIGLGLDDQATIQLLSMYGLMDKIQGEFQP